MSDFIIHLNAHVSLVLDELMASVHSVLDPVGKHFTKLGCNNIGNILLGGFGQLDPLLRHEHEHMWMLVIKPLQDILDCKAFISEGTKLVVSLDCMGQRCMTVA